MTMTNTHLQDLKKNYGSRFQDVFREESVIVYSGDTLHQNTVDDSNIVTIFEELNGEYPNQVGLEHKAYHSIVYINTSDMEENDELAKSVLDIFELLEDMAIYDDNHHSELENSRFAYYLENELAWEISRELDFTIEEEVIQAWIGENLDLVWENCDGSIDDHPYNTEKLAELYKQA